MGTLRFVYRTPGAVDQGKLKIKGINIKDDEHKISLFADDILVYLKDPTESLVELLETLQTFESLSGFKLNILKTQVLTFNYNPPN